MEREKLNNLRASEIEAKFKLEEQKILEKEMEALRIANLKGEEKEKHLKSEADKKASIVASQTQATRNVQVYYIILHIYIYMYIYIYL